MEPRTRMLAVYCASGCLAIFCATDKICQFLVPHWEGGRGVVLGSGRGGAR